MLHDLLSRHRDDIVARCERYYRERNPERTREELLDTLPAFIDKIIEVERRVAGLSDGSHGAERPDDAGAHGERRFKSGFRIRDVVMDYGTISRVVGEIAEEQGIELDPPSYRMLNACLDAAIAQAITHFYDLSVERSEHEVAEWLGSLAHELRNAVSSALLAFDTIRTDQLASATNGKSARVLERSLNRLEVLVSQTLAAVHLKSGAAPAREPVDLHQLIDEVIDGARREREIELCAAVERDLTVIGDAGLLGSALTNLVQNAVKFTANGGRVLVRGRRDSGGVAIEVEDRCGGLDVPGESLFTPFVQRDKKRRGVGLGLSITRRAIEAHRGAITVTNLPGTGCVFAIWLPAE
jgi:signal transduction histidine kinase